MKLQSFMLEVEFEKSLLTFTEFSEQFVKKLSTRSFRRGSLCEQGNLKHIIHVNMVTWKKQFIWTKSSGRGNICE